MGFFNYKWFLDKWTWYLPTFCKSVLCQIFDYLVLKKQSVKIIHFYLLQRHYLGSWIYFMTVLIRFYFCNPLDFYWKESYAGYNNLMVCSERKYYPSKTKESPKNIISMVLNTFSPIFYFYIPWKHQKSKMTSSRVQLKWITWLLKSKLWQTMFPFHL